MKLNVNQSHAIKNLNQYLAWHNLPVRVDDMGICRGLASVYAKYAIQDQQKKFFELLSKIATMTTGTELDDEINHFVVEIVLSQMPHKLNASITQRESIETLQIEGQALKPSFELAMVTSDKNWCEIIKGFQLQNNEVMLVCGVSHAIAISKKNNNYIIYDPNYSSGFKTFSTEEQLIKELHHNLFSPALLGLQIQIIRDPKDSTPREFPSLNGLYKQYLVPTELSESKKWSVNNLNLAIRLNDKEAMDELFAKGFIDKDPIGAARVAIRWNSFALLPTLLQKIPVEDYQRLHLLFISALEGGCAESFHELLKHDALNSCFQEVQCQEEFAANRIYYAAKGGNSELLQYLINAYKERGKPQPLSEHVIAGKIIEGDSNALKIALITGSSQCVSLLLEQLKKVNYQLTDKQLACYLVNAIAANQPHSVAILINVIKALPKESQNNIFSSIHMSTHSVEGTDLSILRQLKANNVPFSATAHGVIERKENRPIGFLLAIGITLQKFSDYIRDGENHTYGVSVCISRFKEAKNLLQDEKKADTAHQQDPSKDGPSIIIK